VSDNQIGAENSRVFADKLNDFFVREGIGWQLIDGQILAREPEAFQTVVTEAASALETSERPTAAKHLRRPSTHHSITVRRTGRIEPEAVIRRQQPSYSDRRPWVTAGHIILDRDRLNVSGLGYIIRAPSRPLAPNIDDRNRSARGLTCTSPGFGGLDPRHV
jgi:hypothetical protein